MRKIKFGGKFFKSLNFRILLSLALTGMVPVLIITGVFLASYEKQALTQLGNDVRNQCQILATQLGSGELADEAGSETLQGELAQLSSLYDGRILIIDRNFEIVEDTYQLEEGRTMVAEEVIRCFKGENISHYVSGRFIEMTVPITVETDGGRKIVGVILASASTDSIHSQLEGLRSSSDMWLVAVGICVLALSILLSGWLIRPLKHMNQSIGGLVEGSLDGDLDIHDCTETENISDTFNLMLAKLRLVEESRQEFVSNVSHELKTPLTSMKVLADSLLMQQDAPVELYQEFMQDIAEEIDRENTIISDLLTLVKMDRKAPELNIAVTDVNEFMELILKRLRPIAEKANVEVVFESNRSVSAEIDATRLSLAFSNLVENAIKYNRENGWVRVMLDADHKFFYVKVSDSGIGIPQESLDYIFERFYRVDKSHSREIGGTGLGLAITRSAVVAHRGAIKVQSEPDVGTTFTVRIPLKYIA
ncbi:MAG: ATP-binding protein [Eubacteriales bacterium]|nr:ATP-binding protein [Eubacteriales bacterium]